MSKKKVLTGIDVFNKIYNNEIDDKTFIVVMCEDHEHDIYYAKDQIDIDTLTFKDYSFGLIDSETALKILKTRELNKTKESLESRLKTVNEDIESLGGSNE